MSLRSTKTIQYVDDYHQVYNHETRSSRVFSTTKRFIDIIGSLLGITFSSPLFLIIALLYGFGEQKGPILFKQCRLGKNGKEFKIYKFRSMVVNADVKLKEDKILHKKYIDNNYKLEPDEDPRITRIGGFLRRTSLDELPQLINVLKGDMSLIGPRPIVLDEIKEYRGKESILLSVKPGITGYWQVSGRSDLGYPERVDIELFYVYNQSIFIDIKIFLKTIIIVLLKKGAY